MYKIYIIEPGETIETIARSLKVSPDVLYDINGFTPNRKLEVGDQIIVPAVNTRYSSYIVKKGDNPYAIAKKFNINVNDLLTINGLEENDYIYPNQELLIPNMNSRYYITKNGDSLEEIATNTGIPIDKLFELNKTIYVVPDQIIFYDM